MGQRSLSAYSKVEKAIASWRTFMISFCLRFKVTHYLGLTKRTLGVQEYAKGSIMKYHPSGC